MPADRSMSLDRWLVRPRPNPGAKLRLFCLPYAGAGASAYRLWPDGLPDSVEVLGVQLPGRETRLREQPHQRMGPLIDDLLEGLAPALDRPFAIQGHSMGSLVGFEWARALRLNHLPPPSLLIASGRSAPQLPMRRRPIHALPDPEFREELRLLDGTPRAVLEHDELMSLFTPIIRADLAVIETYVYRDEPPLDHPILALGGTEDPWLDLDELNAWRVQTSHDFASEQFAGGHFFLQTARPALLDVVSMALRSIQGMPR